MQSHTQTDHAFLVQIWNPRGKIPDAGDSAGSSSGVYLGSPAGAEEPEDCKANVMAHTGPSQAPKKTIMLRDEHGHECTLISVCEQLFLPEGQQVCLQPDLAMVASRSASLA